MPQTLDDIRRRGLEALRRELGPAGMICFLQQFETGSGDYARERHAWVDATSSPSPPRRRANRRARRFRKMLQTCAYTLGCVGRTEENGRSPAQMQAISRDGSPTSEVLGREMLARKTCRLSAAASAGVISLTPDDPEHCGFFLPVAGGRSGRSSKSKS